MVFGRCTDHRRATNINILNGGRIILAPVSYLFKRIEIDDRKIDRFNIVRLHGSHMVRIIADAKQTTMHPGMQSLDPSIHDFRKMSEIRNIANWYARCCQSFECPAG